MTDFRAELARTLLRLQSAAHICARLFETPDIVVEYRVLYCADLPHPWRLAEMHRLSTVNGKPWVLRRLHCFDSAPALQASLQERMRWKSEDRALVARAKRQAGVAVGEATLDLSALHSQRQALRARMCLTRPARVIELTRHTPRLQ